MGMLLGTHGASNFSVRIPETGLLNELTSLLKGLGLPLDLKCESLLHRLEGIQVFKLCFSS